MNQELSVNTTLSHYRIVEKLGAGGMGEVYLAEDTRLLRKVALKLLPAELTADPERVRRFEQEAQAASALSHPNIITIHDIGECDAGRFIVMELVAGRTLRSVIAEDNSIETLLKLGAQMAKALSAAHAAGITHRDIKPDNIMVREDGYVKVLDFGLARLRPATESDAETATLALQTTPGAMMGTVAYMSPEQARGETVSHPSDIFALGIVLYELATGRHPFKAETLVGYLHAITLQEPVPPRQWQPKLPAALNDLLLRMLAKYASQRPTASEVAQVLQAIERGSDAARVQPVESETMMLPSVKSSAAPTDESFWVAVLPFKWRGAQAELEALAEGLSEDIVTGLSRFSYLRVIARSSTLRFTSDSGDVRAIGNELGARYVMEGSLRQAGTKLRLAVQLIDATTGAHLWAENYERSFSPDTVFELQDDLVPRIVSTVADQYGALVHSMSESLRGRKTGQYSPREAVLRAYGYLEHITPEEHAEVREILEAAVASAPTHSDCLAMLAVIYYHEYAQEYNVRPDSLGRAHAAAQRAVAAAPTNHIAHLALANVLFFQKDFLAFRHAAGRALGLNPMAASTTASLGMMIAYAGDWENGLSVVERARQLNPHHPGWYHLPAFYDAYRKRDYRGALASAMKVNMPGYFWAHAALAAVYGQLGEQQRARAALRELHALAPDLGTIAREKYSKWFDAELTEHLIEGLCKAGLEIGGADQAATLPSATDASEVDVPPLAASDTQPASSPTQSIAVLPFANISADGENEYFCDGLAEELLNALAKIDELKVAARTSAFSFKGKNAEAREIGKTLNVNTVLEGSVRKASNRIRINVQLVNAADGYHLWSERYDREMKNIFDVQDEITLAVVDALKVKLLGEQKAALLKHQTRNPDALDAYLQGLSYFTKFTPEHFRKAIACFEAAIAIDPNYAEAYAGLAESYCEMSFFTAPGKWMPKAKEAAAKALELDDSLGRAHNSLAIVKMYYEHDFGGAEADFKRAMALDPRSAHIQMWYGWFLGLTSRFDEGLEQMKNARELDPLSPLISFGIGAIYLWSKRPYEAISHLKSVVELHPEFPLGYQYLAAAYLTSGDISSALDTAENALIWFDDPFSMASAAHVLAKAGNRERALEIVGDIERIPAEEFELSVQIAQVYVGLDDEDRAFAWLEKAANEQSVWSIWMGVDSTFDPLRDDPRFAEMLRRMGLPTKEPSRTDESLEANTMLLAPTTSGKQAGATGADSATPRHTVGRELERNELRAAFNAANDGRGSLLCVAGEPGIGKTTLVEDFLTELTTANSCMIARGRCSERLAGTEAYLPLLEALESLLQNDARLASTMKQIAPTWYAQVMPLAGDSQESARLLAEVKAASQERMKRELASFLTAIAGPQPLVIFFDDLHWADVSTIDLLSFLAGKFDALRVLIVVTYRPADMLLAKHPFLQIKPDLQARGLCRELLLEFLTEAEIADYLTLEFPRHAFPPDFAKLIHAKTEGSPLFMADLVRYLRDRSVIAWAEGQEDAGAPILAQTLPDIERELPESVRGMIERKIAQLSEEDRKLLTCASVQGYEFDSAVLAQVLKLDADEVEERLEKLERIFAFVKLISESEFPNRTLTLKYRFVHVLYQNALHASLRLTRKAALSREVGQALEDFYGEQRVSVANELAKLFELAREYALAARYFLLAAQQNSQVSAYREVVQLALRGLAMLEMLPESGARDEQEISLQTVLGFALIATRGYAAPEVERAYLRARALCRQVGEEANQLPVLYGLWAFNFGRGNCRQALEIGKEFQQIAEARDQRAIVAAHRMIGCTLWLLGEFRQARERLDQLSSLYDPALHRDQVVLYGDSGIAGHAWQALTLFMMGYSDQALKQTEESLRLGREVSHAVSQAYALILAAQHHQVRRELPQARELARAGQALSTEHGLAYFSAWGKILLAWTLAEQEPSADNIIALRSSIDVLRDLGTESLLAYALILLAEVYYRGEKPAAGLAAIDEVLRLMEKNDDRNTEAELYRVRGELLLQGGASAAEVEACFRRAIEIAQRQEAKSWELRAAIRLARLWQRQGKIVEARQMLAEVYGWFTEGFDTADLQEAQALLNELTPPSHEQA